MTANCWLGVVRFGKRSLDENRPLAHHRAEDRETALKIAEPALHAGYRGVRGNPLDILIVGGPGDLVERLEQLKALGTSYVLLRFMVQTQAHILRAIQIIGERVTPNIS